MNDQEENAVWMPTRKAESYWPAEVLHVERIFPNAELVRELFHDVSQPIEDMGEFRSRRCIALSKNLELCKCESALFFAIASRQLKND